MPLCRSLLQLTREGCTLRIDELIATAPQLESLGEDVEKKLLNRAQVSKAMRNAVAITPASFFPCTNYRGDTQHGIRARPKPLNQTKKP